MVAARGHRAVETASLAKDPLKAICTGCAIRATAAVAVVAALFKAHPVVAQAVGTAYRQSCMDRWKEKVVDTWGADLDPDLKK